MRTAKTQSQIPHMQRFSGEWKTKRVSEFGDVVTGETPSVRNKDFWDGLYPWITPTDITSDRDMTISERMVTREGLNSIRRTLPPNTVLVTCIASIGKNAILKTIGSCNQQINAVVPNATHNAEFLYYLFEYNSNYLLANAGVTATPIISKSIFSKFVFQVPSLEEQRSIAEVLSDVDGLLDALEALIAKKQAIKQAVMQQLLTGMTRLPGFSGAWEKTKISDLLVYRRPDPYIVQSAEYTEHGDVPVLTANKAFILGYTDEVSGICHNFPVIVFDDFTTDSKYATFPFKVKSSAIKLLYPKHERVSLKYAFERMQLIDFPLGNHKRYYISEYQNLEIYAPDSDEQHAIASILSDMDAEIASLEQRRDKTHAIKQGMMQQLLTGRVRLVK